MNTNSLSKAQYIFSTRYHYIDSSGIHVSSYVINNTITKGMRNCYQCEFYEFIVTNNLVDEAITNGLVWETVSNYLIQLEKSKYDDYNTVFDNHDIVREYYRRIRHSI